MYGWLTIPIVVLVSMVDKERVKKMPINSMPVCVHNPETFTS